MLSLRDQLEPEAAIVSVGLVHFFGCRLVRDSLQALHEHDVKQMLQKWLRKSGGNGMTSTTSRVLAAHPCLRLAALLPGGVMSCAMGFALLAWPLPQRARRDLMRCKGWTGPRHCRAFTAKSNPLTRGYCAAFCAAASSCTSVCMLRGSRLALFVISAVLLKKPLSVACRSVLAGVMRNAFELPATSQVQQWPVRRLVHCSWRMRVCSACETSLSRKRLSFL